MKKLTDLEKGYVAGVVDGEGHLGLYPSGGHGYARRVGITNTSFELIKYLKNLLDGNVYVKNPRGNCKIQYEWRIESKRASELLNQILPYLIVKKEQAKIIIDFDKLLTIAKKLGVPEEKKKMRYKLYREIRKLNKRGK